ncbi:MAG: GPW/gp25 family protein [Acutalibacteraceae bacterium]
MPVIKGWKFPVQIDKSSGKIQTVEDNECVKQSVRVIIGTQKYERKIVPNFGTDLRWFMFQVVDPNFISEVKSTLTDSITEWEEHIASLNVSVNSSTGPISTVTANIDYITDIEPTQERISQRIDANE